MIASVLARRLAPLVVFLFPDGARAACSVAQGYLPPSDYEQVKMTGAVVLARLIEPAGGQPPARTDEPGHARVTRPGSDGEPGPAPAEFDMGHFPARFKLERALTPHFKDAPIEDGGTLGLSGGYVAGRLYLLFLNQTQRGDRWLVSSRACTRSAEEVASSKAASVKVVEHYVRIVALGDYEKEKTALSALAARAAGGKDPDEYPRRLADEIEAHFRSPSEFKSFADLMAMYTKAIAAWRKNLLEFAATGKPPETDRSNLLPQPTQVLWAFAWGGHEQARPLMRELLAGGSLFPSGDPATAALQRLAPDAPDYISREIRGAVMTYFTHVKDPERVDTFARLYVETLEKRDHFGMVRVLLFQADGERYQKLMLRVLEAADDEEATYLADYFARYPAPAAIENLRRRVGGHYLGTWRTTPNQAIALSAVGDDQVVEWARAARPKGDFYRVPFYVLAYSPLPAADRIARDIIQKGGADLVPLVEGYAGYAPYVNYNPNRWDRLADMVRIKDKSPELIRSLRHELECCSDAHARELLKSLSPQ